MRFGLSSTSVPADQRLGTDELRETENTSVHSNWQALGYKIQALPCC